MGYSKNPATVRKILPELAELLAGKNCTWRTEEPDRWAYKIREALWIAKRNPKLFPDLALVYDHYKITIEGNLVHARLALADAVAHITGQPIESLIVHDTRLVLTGPRSIEEVIQFWLDYQPTNEPFSICEVQGFTNDDLDLLSRWAQGQTPAWEIVHTRGQTSFIIRPSRGRKLTGAAMPVTLAQPGSKPEPEETPG